MKKMVKRILALSLVFVMGVGMLSGCNSSKSTEQTSETQDSNEGSTETDNKTDEVANAVEVRAFTDITWPEAMPANPTLAEDNYYDYDDMSKHYDLEFFTYNYGPQPPANEKDPIIKWLNDKYNVTITFTTSAAPDMESVLSTRFSSGDVPDVMLLPNGNPKAFGFKLGEQDLLVDASVMLPYMPQTTKFVTETILEWSTMEDGSIPFIAKYAIQDGDTWGMAIRQDWLDALGMKMPTTLEELKAYAHACTYDDPDGNGVDDTYFMLGGGGGVGFGMLDGFMPWFGNPSEHVENGVLSSSYLDGSRKAFITFINELYADGSLLQDWFTIPWEDGKAYTLKDKVGMVYYPATALYQEYATANNADYSLSDNWSYLEVLPDASKAGAGGSPGECIAVPASSVEGDQGKLLRICHILDAMAYGGEAYFATVQGGSNEVHEGYDADVREYLEDGSSYCYVADSHPGFTQYGTDNLALAAWQTFGYTLKWQKSYTSEDADDNYKLYVSQINDASTKLTSYERWPNDSLLFSISPEIAPSLGEFVLAQEYKFIIGDRNLNEWDTYIQEYLKQGGLERLTAVSESLGCDLPAELK